MLIDFFFFFFYENPIYRVIQTSPYIENCVCFFASTAIIAHSTRYVSTNSPRVRETPPPPPAHKEWQPFSLIIKTVLWIKWPFLLCMGTFVCVCVILIMRHYPPPPEQNYSTWIMGRGEPEPSFKASIWTQNTSALTHLAVIYFISQTWAKAEMSLWDRKYRIKIRKSASMDPRRITTTVGHRKVRHTH